MYRFRIECIHSVTQVVSDTMYLTESQLRSLHPNDFKVLSEEINCVGTYRYPKKDALCSLRITDLWKTY